MTNRQNFYAESLGDSVRDVTSYATKMSLVFTPEAETRYLILWSATLRSPESAGTACIVQVRHDGSVIAGEIRQENKDGGDRYMSGGAYVMPAEASPGAPPSTTFDIQWKSTDTNFDAIISDATMIALKIRENETNQDEEVSDDSDTSTNSTSFVDKVELSFAPDTAGDYLLICSCEHRSNSVITAIEARVTVDGVARGLRTWIAEFQSTWTTYVMTARVSLAEGSRSIKIQHRSNSGGAVTSRMQNARIIALRLEKFQFNYYAEQLTADSTTNTSFTEFLTLSATLAANDHLVFLNSINGVTSQSISVETQYTEDDASVSPTEEVQERRSELEAHNTNMTKGLCDWAFWKKTYTGAQVRWDIDYRVENAAATAHIDDATIAVVDLTDIGALGGEGGGGASSFNLLV